MENTDIIVLTAIVVVLFLIFIIATLREFSREGDIDFNGAIEGGPRANLIRYIGRIFNDEKIEPMAKITIIDAVRRAIEDLTPEEEKGTKNLKND